MQFAGVRRWLEEIGIAMSGNLLLGLGVALDGRYASASCRKLPEERVS